jgi:hypothetical protein
LVMGAPNGRLAMRLTLAIAFGDRLVYRQSTTSIEVDF